jgi:hypothetical protein
MSSDFRELLPWQVRFVRSRERKLLLAGREGCGKVTALLRAAVERIDEGAYRGVVIASGEDMREELVRRARALYAHMDLLGAYDESFKTWFFASGAQVRFAVGPHVTGGPYDFVGISRVFDFSYIENRRLMALARPGEGGVVRATELLGQSPRDLYGHRVEVDFRDDAHDDFDEPDRPDPEIADLDRLVRALTRHAQVAPNEHSWKIVRQVAQTVRRAGNHDRAVLVLLDRIDAMDDDKERLDAALDEARHRLAERDPVGALDDGSGCHRTCSSACSLRRAR